MADDSNSRYRSDDPYGRPPAQGNGQGSGQGNDPLAELARLIGQNDPFSEFGRDSRAPVPRAQHYASDPSTDWPGSAAPQPIHSYEPFVPPTHPTQAPSEQHYHPDPPYNPPNYAHAPVPPGLDAYQFGEPHQLPLGHVDPAGPYGHQDHASHQDHAGYSAPMGYDAPPYAQQAADAPGFQPQPYPRQPENGQMPLPHDDDFYDDAPQGGRRKGLITVMAVLALAVLGTAGAFGYRSLFGGSSSSSPPPVIRASAEPSKVAPPPSNNESNKLSYDRFGDRSQNEQVVLREEKPVDPRDLARAAPPRVVLPGASNSSNGTSPLAAASANPPSVLTEPKRIRTVPIRPDQAETSTRPQAIASALPPPPAAASPRMAAANNAPLDVAPPSAAPAPVRATIPRQVAQPAPQPSANSPLSLSPDSAPAPVTSVAPARSPSMRVASAPSGNGGGFLVQVTSQRSEADAQSSFRSIQSKYASVIGENQPVIRRADLGDKGVYYRAMVGPFTSRDQAIQVCTSLKAAGGACVVQGP